VSTIERRAFWLDVGLEADAPGRLIEMREVLT
jgi:hypothetical protein